MDSSDSEASPREAELQSSSYSSDQESISDSFVEDSSQESMSIDSESDDSELLVGASPTRRADSHPRAGRRVARAGALRVRTRRRGMGRGVRVRGGLFRGGLRTPSSQFRQGWEDGSSFVPQPHPFTAQPGNAADYSAYSPSQVFQLFFTAAVWDLIVAETNRYAALSMVTWTAARRKEWTPVTVPTMKAFVAVLMMMGIVTVPRYKLYWRISDLLRLPFFPSVFSRNQFSRILRFLHLADNATAQPHDKLAKVRPFLEMIIPRFNEMYTPTQNLSPDESMIKFKGRLGWVQYMPKKPVKWGIKVFALCESNSGYTVNMKLYTGREEADLQVQGGGGAGRQQLGIDPATTHPGADYLYSSGKIVLELVRHLGNKGYRIFCDNFYTSPALFKELKTLGFDACGTCKPTIVGMPEEANPKKNKMKKGDDAKFLEKDGLLLSIWHDKKQVRVLSTMDTADVTEKRLRSRHDPTGFRTVRKPTCVNNYNQNMGGVDKADQYYQYYNHPHRSAKWWKRIFFHMIEVCLVNAFVVYKTANPQMKIDLLEFRLAVIRGLLDGWPRNTSRQRRRARHEAEGRPGRLDGTFHSPGNTVGKPDCVVCSKRPRNRKQTSKMCVDCDAPMCMVPCFTRYHTMVNYRL